LLEVEIPDKYTHTRESVLAHVNVFDSMLKTAAGEQNRVQQDFEKTATLCA
jgi:hypothetical protein